jgi:nicotinamide riboside kinase
MRSTPPIRSVALLGAESTGKSTLAQALGTRLPAIVVDEVLREFCQRHGRAPESSEQRSIADEQRLRERAAREEAAARGMTWVVCDTTPLMIALYSAHYFNDWSLIEPAIAHQSTYALTLLLEPDIDWVADGLQRESPGLRAHLHDMLLFTLAHHRVDYTPVRGRGPLRTARALAHIDALTDCSCGRRGRH